MPWTPKSASGMQQLFEGKARKDLSDFSNGTELETFFWFDQEEELISKDTAAYITADYSPESDVRFLHGAFVVQMLNTFCVSDTLSCSKMCA